MAMKKRLVAIAGIILGIITLRRFRKRSKRGETKQSDIDHEDLDSASGHAAAAADHAKLAAEKAVEERRKSS